MWPLWRSGVPQGKARLDPNWCALGWDSEQKPAASRVLQPVGPWHSTAATAVPRGDWEVWDLWDL